VTSAARSVATDAQRTRLPPAGTTVLVIVAHADDAALFCGGTLRLMAEHGARVVLLRVTDDRYDSVGIGVDETIRRNTDELRIAANILGISEIVDLGWETDRLADTSETALRERFIYHVRRLRPYAVMSFDPYGAFHEDNQDHIRVAHAVDETFWTAQFDKHHPEHFADGLSPHGVYERWYFARRLVEVTTAVDISHTLQAKISAALAHDTMLRHYVNQLRLQARTAGHTIDVLDTAQHGDIEPLFTKLLTAGARATGTRHGLAMAEEFRVVRFGGLERAFDLAEPS